MSRLMRVLRDTLELVWYLFWPWAKRFNLHEDEKAVVGFMWSLWLVFVGLVAMFVEYHFICEKCT